MTPEQVSALSKTELNRAMIWLYPLTSKITYTDQGGIVKYYIQKRFDLADINYLSDYNITMPLAFSNDLSISICNSTERKAIVACYSHSAHDNNPLRAICECLVLIALADK